MESQKIGSKCVSRRKMWPSLLNAMNRTHEMKKGLCPSDLAYCQAL